MVGRWSRSSSWSVPFSGPDATFEDATFDQKCPKINMTNRKITIFNRKTQKEKKQVL